MVDCLKKQLGMSLVPNSKIDKVKKFLKDNTLIKENVVKVPFRKLKYIHHISDIQIRNLKRHIEYEEVFERTYEEVKKHKDNAVVYIGGDIASKTKCR